MNGISAGSSTAFPSSNSRGAKAVDRDENDCTDADEFPRAIAKTAVAQICEATGFHSVQPSALETLADIAVRFLCDTGKVSQFYANLAGRTQSNALDALCAVEDISRGGLTDVHQGIASSVTASELKRFVDCSEEMPFFKPVPHFPIHKKQAFTPSFSQLGEKPPTHIPSWLPAFPDAHTYKATPVWNERKVDPRIDKLEQAKQRRKAERSLVSLHLRLCTSGASSSDGTADPEEPELLRYPSSEPPDRGHESSGSHLKKLNAGSQCASTSMQYPLLLPPLKKDPLLPSNDARSLKPTSTTKTVDGPVVFPSILEAFTPALEAASLNVQETGGASNALGGSLPISMKRKPLCMTFDFGQRASEKAVTASLSLGGKQRRKILPELKDDEKDEKKKRAEQILAQSLEGTEMVSNDRN